MNIVGFPSNFAGACKILHAMFPDLIGQDFSQSFEGEPLTELDKALMTKTRLRTGFTDRLCAMWFDITEKLMHDVLREWVCASCYRMSSSNQSTSFVSRRAACAPLYPVTALCEGEQDFGEVLSGGRLRCSINARGDRG